MREYIFILIVFLLGVMWGTDFNKPDNKITVIKINKVDKNSCILINGSDEIKKVQEFLEQGYCVTY